jgi:hypothetical protein
VSFLDCPCVCGHAKEDHGYNQDYPGSTECLECECFAYEANEDDDMDGDEP